MIFFSCENIDGVNRLYEDLQVICYSKNHKIIAYAVALPALLLWSLGIPTLGGWVIFKNRSKLQQSDVKDKYGFLYKGYKHPHGQYWEIIILYRKIIIIFIQVFLA